ncbi:hypothetical protein HW49_01590 [Porphyromonadaceae bacterium COT-184 OH4590]|nr:hypothetical protein HW49_01590 [Porphyromonadaceae bacterium COT-184 OH4590]
MEVQIFFVVNTNVSIFYKYFSLYFYNNIIIKTYRKKIYFGSVARESNKPNYTDNVDKIFDFLK